jgi:hypothetical protein
MLERWNNGGERRRNNGMMEKWNDGKRKKME